MKLLKLSITRCTLNKCQLITLNFKCLLITVIQFTTRFMNLYSTKLMLYQMSRQLNSNGNSYSSSSFPFQN